MTINELETQILQLQLELNKLKSKPKFRWSYAVDNTYAVSTYEVTSYTTGKAAVFIEHGRYRKSETTAQQALDRNKRANRLEALAEQLDGLGSNYTIGYSQYDKEYLVYKPGTESPCEVYMTEQCAKQICDMLNNGEFSLDGEL